MIECDCCGKMCGSGEDVILFFVPHPVNFCECCGESWQESLDIYGEEFMYEED